MIPAIYEKHKDFGTMLDTYVEVSTNNIYFKNKDIVRTIEAYENQIVDNYKATILDNLDKKRMSGEITYKKYIEKVKQLDEIRNDVSYIKSVLSISEIDTKEIETIKIKSNSMNLDRCIEGFALGELSVWSGSNGSAKSTYLNQLALETINQGYNVLIYSGELTSNRLLKWMVNQCAGRSYMKIHPDKYYWYTPNETKERILSWLDNKLFIYNNTSGNKASQIIKNTKEYIKTHNVKVIFFDNLMSMDLTEYSQDRYEAQSIFVKEISNIAHDLGVHIHFVCHPRKSTSFLRKNDISGSADLTNSADNVFIVHRVNEDFRRSACEFFNKEMVERLATFSNVVEVCKHRETGTQDVFAGLFFEPESKRLLDRPDEIRKYGWEDLK